MEIAARLAFITALISRFSPIAPICVDVSGIDALLLLPI